MRVGWYSTLIAITGALVAILGNLEFRTPYLQDRLEHSLGILSPEVKTRAGEIYVKVVPWRGEVRFRLEDLYLEYEPIFAEDLRVEEISLKISIPSILTGSFRPHRVAVQGMDLPIRVDPNFSEIIPEPGQKTYGSELIENIFNRGLIDRLASFALPGAPQAVIFRDVRLRVMVTDVDEALLQVHLDEIKLQTPDQIQDSRALVQGGIFAPDGATTEFFLDAAYTPGERLSLNGRTGSFIPANYGELLRFFDFDSYESVRMPLKIGVNLQLDKLREQHSFGFELLEVQDSDAQLVTVVEVKADLQSGMLNVSSNFDDFDLRRIAPWTPVPEVIDQLSIKAGGNVNMNWHRTTGEWHANFELSTGTGTMVIPRIGLPSIEGAAVGVRDVRVTGQFDSTSLSLTDIYLETGSQDRQGPVLEADLRLQTDIEQTTLTIDLGSKRINHADLFYLWPNAVATKSRSDVASFVAAGLFEDLAFKGTYSLKSNDVGGQVFELQSQTLNSKFSAAQIQYAPNFPPLTEALGRIRFLDSDLILEVDNARLSELFVNSTVTKVDFSQSDQIIVDVQGPLVGPLSSALDILSKGKIGLDSLGGPLFRNLTGSARADVRMQLAFDPATVQRNGITADDLSLDVKLDVLDLRGTDFLVAGGIEDGDLSFSINQDGLEGSGYVNLAGTDGEVVINQSYGATEPINALSVSVNAIVNEDIADQFIPGMGAFVQGEAPANFTYESSSGSSARLAADIDLTDMSISFPPLVYQKPAGDTGSLRFDLLLRDGAPRIVENLELRGPSTFADGVISLGADDWSTMDLTDVSIGILTADFLELQKRPGSLWISGQGRSLNMEALLGQFTEAQAQGAANNPNRGALGFELQDVLILEDARFNRLEFGGGSHLTDVRLSLVLANDGVRGYTLNSAVPSNEESMPGGRVDSRLVQKEGRYELSVYADNFGALLQALHISADAKGGQLGLIGSSFFPIGGGAWELNGQVTDFRLEEVPSLLELVSVISLTGIADQMSGVGLAFDDLVFDGRFDAPNFEVEELRLAGPSLGLIIAGGLNWSSKIMNFRGALAPFNAVNQIMEDIPVIGELFTGSDGQGIIASQFEFFGPFENLAFRVDALSILQPGIFRSIVDDIESNNL